MRTDPANAYAASDAYTPWSEEEVRDLDNILWNDTAWPKIESNGGEDVYKQQIERKDAVIQILHRRSWNSIIAKAERKQIPHLHLTSVFGPGYRKLATKKKKATKRRVSETKNHILRRPWTRHEEDILLKTLHEMLDVGDVVSEDELFRKQRALCKSVEKISKRSWMSVFLKITRTSQDGMNQLGLMRKKLGYKCRTEMFSSAPRRRMALRYHKREPDRAPTPTPDEDRPEEPCTDETDGTEDAFTMPYNDDDPLLDDIEFDIWREVDHL